MKKRWWIGIFAAAVAAILVVVLWFVRPDKEGGTTTEQAAPPPEAATAGPRPGGLPSGADEHQLPEQAREVAGREVAGVLFTETLISILEDELSRGLGGWRPNNLLIGGLIPLDNVENYQLGVLSVVRRVSIILREKLARRGGGSDEFDPNVGAAMTQFHMDETKFWFPSADKAFAKGLDELRLYVRNLKRGTGEFQPRTDNIYQLLYAFRDLLGDSHQQLIKMYEKDGSRVSMFRTDDYYYEAKGRAHAMHRLADAIAVEFDHEIRAKGGHQVLGEMIESLERADGPDPCIVLNGGEASLRANHRKNLAAWIADARLKVATLQDIIMK